MKIAVVVGSTRRAGSACPSPNGCTSTPPSARMPTSNFDLKPFGLVLLDEETVPGAANRQYERAETRAWSEAVDRFDGFIWVSPEYNHGVPAALKNAFDVLYPGGTTRPSASWDTGRTAACERPSTGARSSPMRAASSCAPRCPLSSFHDWTDGVFTPDQRRVRELTTVLDQVVQMTEVLAPLRQPTS